MDTGPGVFPGSLRFRGAPPGRGSTWGCRAGCHRGDHRIFLGRGRALAQLGVDANGGLAEGGQQCRQYELCLPRAPAAAQPARTAWARGTPSLVCALL